MLTFAPELQRTGFSAPCRDEKGIRCKSWTDPAAVILSTHCAAID